MADRRVISRLPNRENVLFLKNGVVLNFNPYSLHTCQNILDLTDLDRLDSKQALERTQARDKCKGYPFRSRMQCDSHGTMHLIRRNDHGETFLRLFGSLVVRTQG